MERYTPEFKQVIEDSKTAWAFSLPLILREKAKVKLANKSDHMEIGLNGNPMAQLLLLVTASAKLVKSLEADKQNDDDVDTMALFLAAFEMAKEVIEVDEK